MRYRKASARPANARDAVCQIQSVGAGLKPAPTFTKPCKLGPHILPNQLPAPALHHCNTKHRAWQVIAASARVNKVRLCGTGRPSGYGVGAGRFGHDQPGAPYSISSSRYRYITWANPASRPSLSGIRHVAMIPLTCWEASFDSASSFSISPISFFRKPRQGD